MRTALIFNPKAGASLLARNKVAQEMPVDVLLDQLRKQGIEPEIYYTTPEDPGQAIAQRLAAEQIPLVIVVGGDGTIHEVAHGLIGSQSVLGIIPTGTMNNLARNLGIPEDLDEACALLVNGEVRTIDVGKINQQIFLEVAGIGLEAALFPAAEDVKHKGLFSTFRGVVRGLLTLINFRPPRMRIAFDGQEPHTYQAMQVTICNAPSYGLHLKVASEIAMNDGWLNAVLYTQFSKQEYILHAISISRGQRILTPKIISRHTRSLHISADSAMDIHADGIVCGQTPAEISILPDALKVQVPQGTVPGLRPKIEEQTKSKLQERKTYA